MASVSEVPGCMIPVVVEWRPDPLSSVVTGVGQVPKLPQGVALGVG